MIKKLAPESARNKPRDNSRLDSNYTPDLQQHSCVKICSVNCIQQYIRTPAYNESLQQTRVPQLQLRTLVTAIDRVGNEVRSENLTYPRPIRKQNTNATVSFTGSQPCVVLVVRTTLERVLLVARHGFLAHLEETHKLV